jgi:hypothetical protein
VATNHPHTTDHGQANRARRARTGTACAQDADDATDAPPTDALPHG